MFTSSSILVVVALVMFLMSSASNVFAGPIDKIDAGYVVVNGKDGSTLLNVLPELYLSADSAAETLGPLLDRFDAIATLLNEIYALTGTEVKVTKINLPMYSRVANNVPAVPVNKCAVYCEVREDNGHINPIKQLFTFVGVPDSKTDTETLTAIEAYLNIALGYCSEDGATPLKDADDNDMKRFVRITSKLFKKEIKEK